MEFAAKNAAKRMVWIFFSVLALAQFAPALDEMLSPVFDHVLLAAQPAPAIAYKFDVLPHGIIQPLCSGGNNRLTVAPGKTLKTAQGEFQVVQVKARICTEFGYKSRKMIVYLPAELLRPDSDVMQGVWETKTYTGVPSSKDPERLLTLQVHRLSGSEIEVAWLPSELEEPEYRPVRVRLAQPEEMSVVEDWRLGLLPWKELHFEVDHPLLREPLTIDAKLARVESRK